MWQERTFSSIGHTIRVLEGGGIGGWWQERTFSSIGHKIRALEGGGRGGRWQERTFSSPESLEMGYRT